MDMAGVILIGTFILYPIVKYRVRLSNDRTDRILEERYGLKLPRYWT